MLITRSTPHAVLLGLSPPIRSGFIMHAPHTHQLGSTPRLGFAEHARAFPLQFGFCQSCSAHAPAGEYSLAGVCGACTRAPVPPSGRAAPAMSTGVQEYSWTPEFTPVQHKTAAHSSKQHHYAGPIACCSRRGLWKSSACGQLAACGQSAAAKLARIMWCMLRQSSPSVGPLFRFSVFAIVVCLDASRNSYRCCVVFAAGH